MRDNSELVILFLYSGERSNRHILPYPGYVVWGWKPGLRMLGQHSINCSASPASKLGKGFKRWFVGMFMQGNSLVPLSRIQGTQCGALCCTCMCSCGGMCRHHFMSFLCFFMFFLKEKIKLTGCILTILWKRFWSFIKKEYYSVKYDVIW